MTTTETGDGPARLIPIADREPVLSPMRSREGEKEGERETSDSSSLRLVKRIAWISARENRSPRRTKRSLKNHPRAAGAFPRPVRVRLLPSRRKMRPAIIFLAQ